MKPDQTLDDLLRRYAQAPVPPMPGDLEGRVWREIRRRQAVGEERSDGGEWLARWLRLWREPRVAFAGVAAAAAVGVAMSWTMGGPAVDAARADGTRQALDLGVFAAEAPALPSTLLLTPARRFPR